MDLTWLILYSRVDVAYMLYKCCLVWMRIASVYIAFIRNVIQKSIT